MLVLTGDIVVEQGVVVALEHPSTGVVFELPPSLLAHHIRHRHDQADQVVSFGTIPKSWCLRGLQTWPLGPILEDTH